jgi:hypothetical protein
MPYRLSLGPNHILPQAPACNSEDYRQHAFGDASTLPSQAVNALRCYFDPFEYCRDQKGNREYQPPYPSSGTLVRACGRLRQCGSEVQ